MLVGAAVFGIGDLLCTTLYTFIVVSNLWCAKLAYLDRSYTANDSQFRIITSLSFQLINKPTSL